MDSFFKTEFSSFLNCNDWIKEKKNIFDQGWKLKAWHISRREKSEKTKLIQNKVRLFGNNFTALYFPAVAGAPVTFV